MSDLIGRKPNERVQEMLSGYASHTPGPWEMDEAGAHVHATDKTVCHASVEIDEDTPANMRLIAAAPDLLKLADDYLSFLWSEWHADMSQADFDAHPTVVNVRAAIKKARGR